jgi:hypothetical protein
VENEPDDLQAVVIEFLVSLPTTIRTEMLFFVINYVMDRKLPEKTDEFETLVRDYLTAPGFRGFGALLSAIAVIDYEMGSLARKLPRAEAALKAVEREHPNFPKESGLSFPLRRRHWEQARADWLKLRGTRLTAERLQDFHEILTLPRTWQ